MITRRDVNNIATANTLDFLNELHATGVDLDDNSIEILKKHGYIKVVDDLLKNDRNKDAVINNPNITGKGQAQEDTIIEIVSSDEVIQDVISSEEYDRIIEGRSEVIYSGKKIDINKDEWMPESVVRHEKDFIEWIDSINNDGFLRQKSYRKFSLYCQQAHQWLSENDTLSNHDTEEDRDEYMQQEIERCAQNTLYFLNKYLQLKESTIVVGMRQYVATKAHEIMVYLFDAGYSFYLGKPRQMAATSTLGGCALAKTLFKKNHYLKFITQDKEKGEEIFEDKIKYPFSELPLWMRPDVRNDRDNKFALGHKEQKGDREGVNSKIDVVAPTPTAVSGGTPSVAMIDEAGNINILSKIIEDARPTMFGADPTTGKVKMMRQIIVWGTGGEMNGGGKAFEREMMAAISGWKERKFSSGIVPIFFDWTARPGMTKEMYDSEKEVYYGKEGVDAEQSRILFRQQYPSSIGDMFLTTSKTLVPQDFISDQEQRILKTPHILRTKVGYFEPIYGNIVQPEGSDTPFNVVGATFIPVEITDPRQTVIIFQEPKEGWEYRYYQGTDPIASDTGTSKMASAIWDSYYNTVSAVVNYRNTNYREVYLQTMLLGVYYDTKKQIGVQELLEANIGKAYQQYKEYKGRFDTFVFNTELPDALQAGSGNIVGIDNRNIRNKLIIDRMFELIQAFGTKIYILDFFVQLKTFTCTVTDRGNETWGPVDRKHYQDDVLFAVTFAYICAQCYTHLSPINTMEQKRVGIKMVSSLTYDNNYNLVRRYKKVQE
jgi:predicted CoA-binding protein